MRVALAVFSRDWNSSYNKISFFSLFPFHKPINLFPYLSSYFLCRLARLHYTLLISTRFPLSRNNFSSMCFSAQELIWRSSWIRCWVTYLLSNMYFIVTWPTKYFLSEEIPSWESFLGTFIRRKASHVLNINCSFKESINMCKYFTRNHECHSKTSYFCGKPK